MSEPVAVRVADCGCPDTPHAEGHLVYLSAKLSLAAGIEALEALSENTGNPKALTPLLFEVFLRGGVVGANFEPFSVDDLLADFEMALPVAEKANDLYAEAFLRPLGLSLPPTSNGGPTASSTSATRRSTRKLPASP